MEWLNEPNEVEFEYKGFKCAILRVNGLGHLCGYVRLDDSPVGYKTIDTDEIHCHGGITFDGQLQEREGYWIGFDNAHFMDLVPSMHNLISIKRETVSPLFKDFKPIYRNVQFVTEELHGIVDQIIGLNNKY